MSTKGPILHLRASNVEWRLVDGDVVVLDLRDERYLFLNHSGAVVWQRLAGGASRDELIAALVDRYQIEANRAERDLDLLLDQLASASMLTEQTGMT